jgi:hypothetical protein
MILEDLGQGLCKLCRDLRSLFFIRGVDPHFTASCQVTHCRLPDVWFLTACFLPSILFAALTLIAC